MRFIDLFAGLGGFNLALRDMGHRCAFASEIDEELCTLYLANFGLLPTGDLRKVAADDVPRHDILWAGCPCQPFSKAGEQLGTKCRLWGDLFMDHVLRVIAVHLPTYLLMENVANLERHDGGRTWSAMKGQLEQHGYEIATRVLSPHRFGVPQIRERLFIVGSRKGLSDFSWPSENDDAVSIRTVLDRDPPEAKPLSQSVIACLDAWQEFLDRAPKNQQLPSFPIWTMEFGATYPFTKYDSLFDVPLTTLRNYRGAFGQTLDRRFRRDILERVPSYARAGQESFPRWKQQFIRQNRDYFARNKRWIKQWLPQIRGFPSSFQKFEWNCVGST